MLKDLINEYYLTKNFNCAKTMLMAANEYYDLKIPAESGDLVAAFGAGLGCGKSCGALCGSLSALGKIFDTEDKAAFTKLSGEFVADFDKALGGTDCADLKPKYAKEGVRCIEAVELGAEVLENFVRRHKEMTEAEPKVSPEEMKRVKGLGFLQRKGTDTFNCRVITRNGKITAKESSVIAEAAEKYGNGEVALTTRLTIEIQGVPYENIDGIREFLQKEGLETGGTGNKVRPVVACKGTTCQYGLCDTFGISEEVHKRFYLDYHQVTLPHKYKIAVGGCPNNCVKPDLNDIGVIGQRLPIVEEEKCKGCKKCSIVKVCPVDAAEVKDGVLVIDEEKCNHCGRCVTKCNFGAVEKSTYGFRICIGGRWGKKTAQGRYLRKVFQTEAEVYDVLEKSILLFKEQGNAGERFADTIARLGFDAVEQQLFNDDLLRRKEEILG